MRFGVLGPLAVWTSGGHLVRVPEFKVRLLLAGLLVDPGRLVPADRLIEDLWGSDLPANPTASLQTRASQLRRVLDEAEEGGRGVLVSRPPGYLLDVAPGSVDTQTFHDLLARARTATDPAVRAALISDALALWRGPAFGEFADHDFARIVTTRLEDRRLTALEEQAEARLELGEHDLVADELGDLTERHPLRERMRAAHMRALYRAGRQSEALDGYHRLRTRLSEELGLDPGPALAELYRAILAQELDEGSVPAPRAPSVMGPVVLDTSAVASPPASTDPAPGLFSPPEPATSLVGRGEEVARIVSLLEDSRLVTLTGPGGVGKTRLALAVAAGVERPDGVHLVDLSGVDPFCESEPHACTASVVETIAMGLSVRDDTASAPDPDVSVERGTRRLVEAVRSHDALLVLDNCEHLVEPVAEVVTALLRGAPALTVLVTGQTPLLLGAERVWPVRPLPFPEPGAGREEVVSSAAVALFVERASAADPGFALTDDDVDAVIAICRRLDGLPLALELAAAKVRSLGVRVLAERMDDRFSLLSTGYRDAPDRQRTLRSMIDWSWDLIEGPERAVLRRLSVHAEGCTLEAAETVCADESLPSARVLESLTTLVDRSLVTVSHDRFGPRYRLLESVAAYGLERLREAGEEERVRSRHLDHHVGLAERADPHLRTTLQREWLDRLDTESADLRRALTTARRIGATDRALRLVNALAWYWMLRGRSVEGGRLLDLALEMPGGDAGARRTALLWRAGLAYGHGGGSDPDPDLLTAPDADEAELRARWYLLHSGIGFTDAGSEESRARNGLVLDAFEASGPWGAAAVSMTRAREAYGRSELDALREHAERGRARFVEIGDRWGLVPAAALLGSHAEIVGDHSAAARHHREGMRVAEDLCLWTEVGERLISLGRIALLEGDLARAEELHERARRTAVEHGHVVGEEAAVLGLGMIARRRGDLDTARRHLESWLDWHLRTGSDFGAALILAELGFVAESEGDAEAALRSHLRGLEAARRTGDPRAWALALEGAAGAYSLAGDVTRAVRLLGAAESLRASVGAPLPEAERGDVGRIERRVAAAIRPGPRERERALGRALSREEALAEAVRSRS
ncbi:AfsR/SARP family transcriptional regulator [Nocardiopsis alba]|uniref:AfsR/SARP family transcriptional regulator n=1 Tax=Nocardiopsis alba TaxID=53437 RepID=UPI0033A03B6E